MTSLKTDDTLGSPRIAPAIIAAVPDAASAPTPSRPASGLIKPAPLALTLARNARKSTEAPIGKRVQATYPMMKPAKDKFVRVHPDAGYRMAGILTYWDNEASDLYYVSPDLELPPSLSSQTKISDLYAAQAHDGTSFIWYVHRSDTSWYRAAQKSVQMATQRWIRVVARRSANSYDLYEPEDALPEPDWSRLPSFMDMVESGFEEKMILSLDHPIFRRLRGLIDEAA